MILKMADTYQLTNDIYLLYFAELQNKAIHPNFENHLNYFHESGAGLPANLARGLALFLNSTAVDQYFRMFSGHTQVNATDLRNLHFPTRAQLVTEGKAYGEALAPQEEVDATVEALLS